ncbi:tetratricopeptide repeat protein [Desulfopila sp. IMCC35008]|uniref:tetratricopeptide repeat protein n=1 Tax=Desulfopila sp. IMCC35008 TaxID=2653858 RepID=UPI0013D727EA|nr:tetratricopeptide repeat protein [Desulfopila sp. IMCC35008]
MNRTYFHLTVPKRGFYFLLFICASFFLHGCASVYQPLPRPQPSYPQPTYPSAPQTRIPPPSTIPDTTPEPPPLDYEAKTGAAASLYNQSRELISQGQYRQAELTLERALRIEPKNGYYWYTMADLKYRQNKPGQAVQFCLKSKSLAGRDKKLVRLNEALIRKAQ